MGLPSYAGRSLPKGPKIMSIHPFPLRKAQPAAPFEAYFSAEQLTPAAPVLRPLSALEQMYAYWGSDRA